MQPEQSYSRLDNAFARFLGQRSTLKGQQRNAFEALLMQLSSQQSSGHSCIKIDVPEKTLLLDSGCVSETGQAPLIVEKNRLYMQRYWFYEQRLAEQIGKICARQYQYDKLNVVIDRYFVDLIDETDWQKEAAKKALTQAFSIITGGPGTGKTTTVVKILALLLELSEQTQHIALAAPTGKAAMRLQESIGASIENLPCSEFVKNHIPVKVTTIHHLLGSQPPSPYFKHDAARPLPFDLVVVDEASMVDLALMSKLVDALKPDARLILLGDKDQLASVESGAVLADLTAALPGHAQELRKSHRFQGEIKALAEAINQQQAQQAWQILQKGQEATAISAEEVQSLMVSSYRRYLELLGQGAGFKTVFAAFNRFQVLCSNRNGPQSVVDINYRLERLLLAKNLISLNGQWYAGRPVMVTENNAAMQLFNGDIGLCMEDAERSGQLSVYFLRPDGSIKKILPASLPKCETVFAMTIHKSQGSEFEHVLIVLAEQINPVLTKELLYTGITRAKASVKIMAKYDVFATCVQQQVGRSSGLADKLTGFIKN